MDPLINHPRNPNRRSCLKVLGGQLPEVGTEQLGALNVVGTVQLLVDGVGTIGRATHGQQEDVLVKGILEGQGDGDRASLASQVGLDLEDALDSSGGSD